ncbi:uncharacterized protein LOC120196925 isoform X2 [Hibiscus syriacus]|uniref:uncharacterized protein LOC120196925 isoform X2 n=1 Tax=Hibiscus syriacus TaxID=106335 RepID=UPI00192356E6|nr:uncharacterized protein LOC120196925 isoform X2 [Hibiscus syriacus]
MKKTRVAEGEAEGQHKQNRTKSGKTQAQRDAHNKSCQRSRQRIKRRREELEEVETKYYEMVPKFKKMQTENREMKLELVEDKSIIRKMENDIQQLRTTLEAQIRNEARMRQIPMEWKVNGQNFTSFDESVGWFLTQTNVQDGQASGTCTTVLNDAEACNFPLFMADFGQQIGFGQDYTNAANHAGSSSAAGVWINSVAGSSDANYDYSELGVTNNHDNLFDNDLAAGVQTHSAAVLSLGANPQLPIAHDATNDHENVGDLFTLGPDAGFQPCENPSPGTVWEWSS